MSRNSPMPAFIAPQIPVLSTEPPTGGGWIHEIKHDGFRTLVGIDRGKGRASLVTVTIGAISMGE